MPASQKTPNYQLPIYAEEDVTSYLQDFNPAMQKIDTQMKANADAAAAAQSDADSLDTRVTALENAPAGVTELDSDTDVTGFENGYILINNNGKLGAIEPSGGTGTDPNAIHASGGGTFSASEGIGSTGPYNIVVDEEPAGVPITSDDVTIPESATAFGGQTVTEALESLHEGESSGAAAENVSYDNATSGLAATNVQDAIDEVADYLYIEQVKWNNITFPCSFAGQFLNKRGGQLSGLCADIKNNAFVGSLWLMFENEAQAAKFDPYSASISFNDTEINLTYNQSGNKWLFTPESSITTADNGLYFIKINYRGW